MYALTTALTYELVDSAKRGEVGKKAGDNKPMEDFHKQVDTFFRFTMDNFEDELAVMGAKAILGTYKLPIMAPKLKNWVEFCKRYSDLIPNV
jgi:hypothetical protein